MTTFLPPEISIKIFIVPFLSKKKEKEKEKTFQEYPKQGSLACWNSVRIYVKSFTRGDLSRKECLKSSKEKGKKFKRKKCVINLKEWQFTNKGCYREEEMKKKEKKETK